jgi:uncharacterized cofD-like protein
MTQPGETDGFTASDHVTAMYEHVGTPFLDTIIVNTADVPEEVLEKYAEKGSAPVVCDIEQLRALGLQVVADQFIAYEDGFLRHNAKVVSQKVVSILKRGKE